MEGMAQQETDQRARGGRGVGRITSKPGGTITVTRWRHSIAPADFLISDYFEISSEPHRRYPTIADWPCLVIQEAVYFDSKGPDVAERLLIFLTSAFAGWSRRVIALQDNPFSSFDPFTLEPFEPYFLRRFTEYLADETSGSEVLSFEAVPPGNSPQLQTDHPPGDRPRDVIVRVEIHKAWFALTMFLPIAAECRDDVVRCQMVHRHSPILEASFRQAADPGTWGEVLNWFYESVVDTLACRAMRTWGRDAADTLGHLCALVADFRGYISGSAAENPKTGSTSVTIRRGKARKRKAETSAATKPLKVFTDFVGILLPEDMVRPPGLKGPAFVRFSSNAEISGIFRFRATLSYLEKMSRAFYFSVFRSGGADVIACYLRRGSAIYMSNIGSQRSPSSRDPLRFLIIYPNSGPYLDPSSPAHENRRWWLGRLIHRLLSAGTMRVKALRDLKDIYEAGEKLAGIEKDVEELEGEQSTRSPAKNYSALTTMIRRLTQISSGNSGSLLLRVHENRLAYLHMQRQLADLEIVRIPGWQSYSAFVNRRLVNTYAKIGAIVERYDRLWSIIRTRMEAVEAQSSVNLQRIGTSVAVIGLPAALTPIVSNAFDLDQKTANYVTGEAQLLTLCGSPMIIPGALCAVEQIVSLEPVVFIAMLVLSVAIWITVSRTVAGQAGNQTGSVRSGADAPNN